jgi:hypothetical protein
LSLVDAVDLEGMMPADEIQHFNIVGKEHALAVQRTRLQADFTLPA